MKKLSEGEKNVCIKIKISRVLLFALIFSGVIFAQRFDFPVLNVNVYSTSPGLDKIFVFNADNKSPYDLMFYNQTSLGYTFHSGSRMEKRRAKYFFYPITEIKFFKHGVKGLKDKYLFTSQKKNVVGMVSFTEYGGMRLPNVKKVKNYPVKVDAGKYLAVPEERAIVFGKNYNGVTSVSEDKFKIKLENLLHDGYYQTGGFVDLDVDGYNDLVLFDVINRKLNFYLNVANIFQLTKQEEISGTLSNFKVNDFDGDRVRDFSFLNGKFLTVYIVNSNPQNIKRLRIKVGKCLDYKFMKINNDNLTDVIAIDDSNMLRVFYNLGKNKFSNGDFVAKIEGGKSLATLWDNNQRDLIILSDKGSFYKLRKKNKIDTTTQVLLSGNEIDKVVLSQTPKNIDVCWLDKSNYTLRKISVSGKNGEIKQSQNEIPYFPDEFSVVDKGGNSSWFFIKYLHNKFSYLLENNNKINLVFTDTNKFYSLSDLLIQKSSDSLKIFRPVKSRDVIRLDTISLSSKPIEVFASTNDEVAYLNGDLDLVFDYISKSNYVAEKALYKIKKIKNLYNLKSNIFKSLMMGKNGQKIDIISSDTLITYYSSSKFSTSQILPFLFVNEDSKKLIIYNFSDSSFWVGELKEGKSYLRFRKVLTKKGINNFEVAKIGKKNYIIFYDSKINSVVFQNIL